MPNRKKILEAVKKRDVSALVTIALNSTLIKKRDLSKILVSLRHIDRLMLSDEADTAFLRIDRNTFSITLGAQFVVDYIHTADDLAFLFLHELSHLILLHYFPQHDFHIKDWDYFGLKEKRHIYENYVLDIQVNVFLYELLGEVSDLQRRLYAEGLAHVFFCPPEMFGIQSDHCNPDKIGELMTEILWRKLQKEIHKLTFSVLRDLSRTYHAIWFSKYGFLQICRDLLPLVPFLEEEPPLIFEVKALPEYLPGMRLPKGLHERLERLNFPGWFPDIVGDEVGAADESLAFRMAKIIMTHIPRTILERFNKPAEEADTPVMLSLSRKQAFSLCQNIAPLFFPLPYSLKLREGRVRIYVDVSGSTCHEWGTYSLALRLVFPQAKMEVFQFSNVVLPFNVHDQHIDSTYGTDFDCVVDHTLKHRPPEDIAIILTDGYACLDEYIRKKAQQKNVKFIVLVTSEIHSNMLETTFKNILAPGGIIFLRPETDNPFGDDLFGDPFYSSDDVPF